MKKHIPAAPQRIRIGTVVATSGPAALLGKSFLKSIELAREDVESAGTKNRYELLVRELRSPEEAQQTIRSLIDTDKVDALIVGFSISGNIVKPYAAAAKIPLFCICSVAGVGDDVFTFTIMPLAEDEAARWIREAKERGVRTIARITQDYPSINNHVRALGEEMAKAGIRMVYEEAFPATTTDFRLTIAKAKKTSPDLYFVEAFNPPLDTLGEQLRDAGVRGLASVVAFSTSDRPELFEDGWYTDSYVSPEFKARLDQRYPATRLATHMMPYAYDSFKILVEGFESGQDILTYVRNMTEYDGTAGRITKMPGTGNFHSSPPCG